MSLTIRLCLIPLMQFRKSVDQSGTKNGMDGRRCAAKYKVSEAIC